MSDEVYRAIANAASGFLESPAGCGKTEAIVRTVGAYCSGCELILTHTHAGVDALRQRFRQQQVSRSKYHVDTIAGWSWSWVRKYPDNGGYSGSTEIAEWNEVFMAMTNLLQKNFVKQGILNSYVGVIVDEYQDCTLPMHQLIVELKRLLPCRVLGDDLQSIFDFRGDPLVGWSDVTGAFTNNLGRLNTPHRWVKADNERLGHWLLAARADFRQNREPDYRGSPVHRRIVQHRDLGPQLVRLTYQKQGRICVIGPKARSLPAGIDTVLVNQNYRVLEPNELSACRDLILTLSDGSPREKSRGAIKFLTKAFGGLSSEDKTFVGKLLRGERQRPRRADRVALSQKHTEGITPLLILDLLGYIQRLASASLKLRESVSALTCILEEHIESHANLKSAYADEIARRKYQSRSNIYRCSGSTLLVKGLEFDHAIVLRNSDWQRSWGTHKDLYVALTRGSKSTTLVEITGS
jgi:DNA helicase-2/ATP-dependent DNA helicase PcrA